MEQRGSAGVESRGGGDGWTRPCADAEVDTGRPVSIGVVGLGAFGRFCVEAYLGMPGVQVVAIADPNPHALAAGTALAPHARAYADPALVMALPDVAVVALCVPPDCQLALVLAAVLAGKHVVCDKPLGLSLTEFDRAVAAAAAHGVALGINLVLRHSALYEAVQELARSGVLGALRRLAVENYADEVRASGPGHWFLNPARSGGLTLAADIHWLDLATRLLGPVRDVQTWETGADVGSRRLVTTAHAAGAVTSIYHAFDTHSGATGCTVLAAFDEGEVRVDGWVPTTLTLACAPERAAAVAAVLGARGLSVVASGDDPRAVLVLRSGLDRRTTYLEMIRSTLRHVLAQARGQEDANDLASARGATAAALAAERAAVSRGWVSLGTDEPREALSAGL
jgi:predicted dehydrogenase